MEKLKTIWRDENGATAMFIAAALLVFLAVAALAIDTSYLYGMRSKLQHAADAAALAGASLLPNETTARAEAISYAAKNMPTESHGNVLAMTDVTFGNWNAVSRTFTPAGSPLDAASVTLRRSAANGNPVSLFFASAMGFGQADVAVQAIAWFQNVSADPCYINGMVAGGQVQVAGSSSFTNGYCLTGANGVTGGGIPAVAQAIQPGPLAPPTASEIGATITGLMDGSIALPSYIMHGMQTVSSLPSTLVPGTAYLVNGNANIGGWSNLTNVAILATGSIQGDSHATYNNVILAGRTSVSAKSHTFMGDTNYASTGGPTVQILSEGDIGVLANSKFHGVEIVSGGNVSLGANQTGAGVAIQAAGNIKLTSNTNFSGSTQVGHAEYGSGGTGVQRLRLVN